LEKAFWDPHGLLALPRPLRDLEVAGRFGLLSLGLGPPFVKLAAGLDGGHGAGPPGPTQQLLQVLPLHAPIRPNPSPFRVSSNTFADFYLLGHWVGGGGDSVHCAGYILPFHLFDHHQIDSFYKSAHLTVISCIVLSYIFNIMYVSYWLREYK
jgi:hypothetical protein